MPTPRWNLLLFRLTVVELLVTLLLGLFCLSVMLRLWALAPVSAMAAPVTVGAPATAQAVSYDIVYVRQPRKGDNTHMRWPEVFHPATIDPGADLMLLHPDGTEEVLVAGGDGAVTDPFISFDGQWVYYALYHDARPTAWNDQRNMPVKGSDIFRINLQTRAIEQLTHQEFTPNTGAGNWDESNPVNPPSQFNRLGYGILNLGPAPVTGGKVVFVSNRNGFIPTKGYTNPALQLFVMDEDSSNVTWIGALNIGSALHPTPLKDGRIMFSSYESQGLRDQRLWALWSIWPDGRQWEPLVSAFKDSSAFHFATQLSNEDIVIEDYYNLNNFGFGALYRFPVTSPNGGARFHPAAVAQNPAISQTVGGGNGFLYPFRMPFTPRGMYSISPFTTSSDQAAPLGAGSQTRVGKFTHPSAAPNNDLLVAWSPGPVNLLSRPADLPTVDAGLYLIPNGGVVKNPNELILIKNDPNYNEVWPRAVVPYRAVHGVDAPAALPWLPNEGAVHNQLPAGSAYGLVGTSSFYKRESFPGYANGGKGFGGLDAFNTSSNDQSNNWSTQGADAGKYTNADIWAVRILAMEPNTHRSYGPNSGQRFFNHVNEKLRILGEIPLRKFDANGQPILDPEGNPDTSFLAKIPADTSFTFQTIDCNGLVLNMAQTWHQVRPGEVRADCGGCHAHSQQPLAFAQTAAAQPGYQVWDLFKSTPLLTRDTNGNPGLKEVNASLVNVEFFQDIRPVLQRSCVQCHTQSNPGGPQGAPGKLVLDDLALYSGPNNSGLKVPGDYARLCFDSDANWGYPPLVSYANNPWWRQSNASRYVRLFQSRRSLLIWKLFGQRLDGWGNADHPTESVPGDPTTLPAGAQINDADLDYTGTIMPPPGSGVPPLSEDEKLTFARWVDLGCPINGSQGTGNENYGWFLDDMRPALTVSQPRPGYNAGPLTTIRIGIADAYSGIKPNSLSIKTDVVVEGRQPGAELVDMAQQTGEGIYTLALTTPINNVTNGHIYAAVSDNQGNITRVNQEFSVDPNGVPGATPTFTPLPTATPTAPGGTPRPTVTMTPLATPTFVPTVPGTGGAARVFLPVVRH